MSSGNLNMILRRGAPHWTNMIRGGPPSFQKHPYANPATTFYKRDLPSNCVSFGGPEGKQLFREALDAGTMECYFGLAEQFRTQSEPAFCGLGSLVMSLNALGTDPMRVWKGPWRWIDEEMLDCCSPLEVISQKGVTMSEFSCLAACNGANCVTKYASKHSEEEFRKDVMQTTVESSGVVLVVSYDRSSLGQTGTGHFSPIGGFLESRNRVLVLDVARFKYPPHWLDLSELYRAMLPPDEVTGKSRGWHLLTRRKQQLSFLHFPGHISGRLWYEFVERVKCIMDKDNLLNTLVELAQDEKFAPVFPTLVPGAEDERWHIMERAKSLGVMARLPSEMPESRKVVVALLHAALVGADREEAWQNDKPFRAELEAARNLISLSTSFCESCNCERKHTAE